MAENGHRVKGSHINKGFTGQHTDSNSHGANGSTRVIIEEGKGTKRTCFGLSKRNIAITAAILVILFVVGFIGALVYMQMSPGELSHRRQPTVLGNYSTAAIATDAEPCAKIGVDVLQRGGTAVDSAIAVLFCNGVFNPHSMGIGGGFLMTIYLKEKGEVVTLNARETAPAASSPNMYVSDPSAAKRGAKSIATPGELKGYWEAKHRYGNSSISWESLLKPTIAMCYDGVRVNWHLSEKLESTEEFILKDPGLRSVFINPKTGHVLREGEVFKRDKFCSTLEKIAKNGAEEFYTGETAKKLVADITNAGGIITLNDLKDYKVEVKKSQGLQLQQDTFLHSFPLPGSGDVLAFILNIMKQFEISPGADLPLLSHRMAEAFKWAYAKRAELGDPTDPAITEKVNKLVSGMMGDNMTLAAYQQINDNFTVNEPAFYNGNSFVPDDHGTSHTSVIAPNGDAVSTTSTINYKFGAAYLSQSTGIIMNDEMDDFSSPNITNLYGVEPSKENFIRPGKRPLSSMCPTIIIDENGDASMVLGAAGGTRITTAVAQVIIKNLWLKEDIKSSIDTGRIHHQLIPMRVEAEESVSEEIKDFLASRRHVVVPAAGRYAVVQGISRQNGRIYVNSDYRKAGGIAGY